MALYQIMKWRDIPTQIRVRDETRDYIHHLPSEYHRYIEEQCGGDGSAYTAESLNGWMWTEWVMRDGDAEAVATSILAELRAKFDPLIKEKTAG